MNALTDYINQAALIIREIKKSKKNYSGLGIDDVFFQKFEETITELKNLDAEQETLIIKCRSKQLRLMKKSMI